MKIVLLFLALLVLALPSFSYAQFEREIKLLVFLNDLVPQISNKEKRMSFEMDRDFFHKEIYDKLSSEIKKSNFLKKVEDKSVLVLTGEVNRESYKKGALSDQLTYLVFFAQARDSDQKAKKLFLIVPVTVNWSEGTPLNDVLKPKIRDAVNLIIKEVVNKK